MDDYVNHLLSYLPREKIKTFTYGHVIPKDNLMAIPIDRGMDGTEFNFTFDQRRSEKMVRLSTLNSQVWFYLTTRYRSSAWVGQ